MDAERDLNQALLNIADREQRLIAQELHDTLCQTLVGLSLLAKTALRARQRGRQVEVSDLSRISDYLDTAIEQSRLLGQPQELFLRPSGLVRALEDLARRSTARISCELHVEDQAATEEPRLAQAFYRVARETVQNIVQEGKASRIGILFRREETRLVLEIRCDRPAGSGCSVFNGDGFLARFADAAGLHWNVKTDSGREAVLRVSASSAA